MNKAMYIIISSVGVLLLSYVFYDSLFASIFLCPIGIILYRSLVKESKKKERLVRMQQIKDWMESLSASVSAGYAFENAIRGSKEEMKRIYGEDSYISDAVGTMTKKLDWHTPVLEVLTAFAKESEIEELVTFAQLAGTAMSSGGNLKGLINSTAIQIRGKMEVEREIAVIISGKQYEQRVLMCIPIVLIFYMRLTAPDTIAILYGNVLGYAVMTICLAIYLVSVIWGMKITRIEA